MGQSVFRRQPVDRFFSLRVTITRISARGTRDRVAQARTTTRLPQVSRRLTTPQGRTAPKSRMHRARRGNCGVHTSVNGEVTTESLNRQVILPLGPRQPPLSSVCKSRLPSLSAPHVGLWLPGGVLWYGRKRQGTKRALVSGWFGSQAPSAGRSPSWQKGKYALRIRREALKKGRLGPNW